MKSSLQVLMLAASSFGGLAEAGLFSLTGNVPAGVLPVSFERFQRPRPVNQKHARRDAGTLSSHFGDDHIVHVINVTIGTPPQPISMVLDTGSSDLIVRSTKSKVCEEIECVGNGFYDPKKSSSYKHINNQFSSKFGSESDGSSTFARGDVANETMTIGDMKIEQVQLAIVQNATIPLSIFGLGFPKLESQYLNFDDGKTYDNLPLLLKDRGIVKDYGYSIWSDEPTAKTGTILFGGVDTAKYTGKLRSLDILQHIEGSDRSTAEYLTMSIGLAAVNLKGNPKDMLKKRGSIRESSSVNKRSYIRPPGANWDKSIPYMATLVDSGTTVSFIPDEFFDPIMAQLEVTYEKAQDTVMIDCQYRKSKVMLEFVFPLNTTVEVPLRHFIVEVDDNMCSLHALPTRGREPILGASFMGSFMTTFDLQNHKIYLGTRNFGVDKSDVKTISVLSQGTGPEGTGGAGSVDAGESKSPSGGETKAAPTPSSGTDTGPEPSATGKPSSKKGGGDGDASLPGTKNSGNRAHGSGGVSISLILIIASILAFGI